MRREVTRTLHIHSFPLSFGLGAVHINFPARQNTAVCSLLDPSQISSVALILFSPLAAADVHSWEFPHSAVT